MTVLPAVSGQAETAAPCGVKCVEGVAVNRNRSLTIAFAGAVLVHFQAVLAVGAGGPGQTQSVRQSAPAPAQTLAQKRPEAAQVLQQGVVTALSAQGDHVEIQGQPHFRKTHRFLVSQFSIYKSIVL